MRATCSGESSSGRPDRPEGVATQVQRARAFSLRTNPAVRRAAVRPPSPTPTDPRFETAESASQTCTTDANSSCSHLVQVCVAILRLALRGGCELGRGIASGPECGDLQEVELVDQDVAAAVVVIEATGQSHGRALGQTFRKLARLQTERRDVDVHHARLANTAAPVSRHGQLDAALRQARPCRPKLGPPNDPSREADDVHAGRIVLCMFRFVYGSRGRDRAEFAPCHRPPPSPATYGAPERRPASLRKRLQSAPGCTETPWRSWRPGSATRAYPPSRSSRRRSAFRRATC